MLEPSEALEVYYIIDEGPENFDRELIGKCIRVFITAKLKFSLVKFQEIKRDTTTSLDTDSDAIKRGITTLNNAMKQLKLKTRNSVWIVYITNGDILNVRKDIGLVLINKCPMDRECSYSINTHPFNILTTMDRTQRLEHLKVFTKTFEQACMTTKTIKYKSTDIT
ncbi:MAG: hypothetical protein EBU90_14210 [Proteobacteria bacterium]|nr:hypothetical protein [Pseudomonadota bacterium]NBP14263.1 hypothetical protein [bacterium]